MKKLGSSGLPNGFLPGDREPLRPLDWVVRCLAALCVVALTVGLVHLVHNRTRPADPAAVAAEGFADGQAAAFAGSASAGTTAMSAQDRSAGLPAEAVAGLSWNTAAGPMRLVLPGGLGPAQTTRDGQIVYPDAGSGFDFLAENTPAGARTVARISSPAGVRAITTFLRTSADVVMLAHTNGYLTVNRATPTAETVAMFAPSEARDANGQLVPSSYVVRQYGIGLYQLSEVIAPTEKTAWPVYVVPPVDLTAPLPQFDFSSITDTISGAAASVAGAATSAASAVASGASAVGTFVKNNPLESAMLVGGVALSLTGVGGAAGGMMIAAAAVNVSSAVTDVVAAHNPDNVLLGNLSTTLAAASMVTPQGMGKRAIKEVVEEGVGQAVTRASRHADEFVIDVAESTPTPPGQLVDEIAEAVRPGIGPKSPNAAPAGGVYVVYDRQGTPVYVGRSIDVERRLARHASQGAKLRRGEAVQIYRTDDLNTQRGVEQILMDDNGTLRTRTNPDGRNIIRGVSESNPNSSTYNQAGQDYLNGREAPPIVERPSPAAEAPQPAERPSSDAEQRANQSAQAQSAAEQQRESAQKAAQDNNNQSGSQSAQRDNNSGFNGNRASSDNKKEDKKSKQHHPRPTG